MTDNYALYWLIIAVMASAGLLLLIIGIISLVKGKNRGAAILLFLALILLFLALGCGSITHICQAGSPACQ